MTTRLTRRQVLKAGAVTVAGLAVGDLSLRALRAGAAVGLPPTGANAPFDHVVVCMMENRSFDHFLGWLPGADGRQPGLTFTDTAGNAHATYDLAPDYEGCSFADPDHSYQGGLKQLNGGKMDGFLKTAAVGDTFPIGYYTGDTVNVLGTLVQNYATSDNYFCAILSATYPNRFYQHSAQTDRDSTSTTSASGASSSSLPAIWDQLTPLGTTPVTPAPTGRYYSTDLPFLALWGTKYAQYTFPFTQFLADCASGTLPNVAYVDPEFLGEGQGFSRDDHPHADVRAGEFFINTVYNAVRSSPNWGRTVLVFNYDEWGGFYDHVPPPHVVDDKPLTSSPLMDTTRLGFRVPLAVVSPLAPKGSIVNGGAPFEHTSILRMIEWRFGLKPMAARDANARNLAEMLDLTSPPRTDMVTTPTPATAVSAACSPLPGTTVPEFSWAPGVTVGVAAAAAGWTVAHRHRAARPEIVDPTLEPAQP